MNGLKRQKEIHAAATPDPILTRYAHGGGRSYVLTPERELVADYYNEGDREFYHTSRTDWPELTDWAEKARLFLVDHLDRITFHLEKESRQAIRNIWKNEIDDVKKLLAELPE